MAKTKIKRYALVLVLFNSHLGNLGRIMSWMSYRYIYRLYEYRASKYITEILNYPLRHRASTNNVVEAIIFHVLNNTYLS